MDRFMTDDWAGACHRTINDWPGPERSAGKLQEFWDWIDMVRPAVTGRVALGVRDMPDGNRADTLVLDFDAGTVTAASVAFRADVEAVATYLLAGSYADWCAMLHGYDVGKMVMYRRLFLDKGDILQFFRAAFFWTEMLAAIQSVPVEAPQAA